MSASDPKRPFGGFDRAMEAWYHPSMHDMVAARAPGKRSRSLRLKSVIGLVPLRIPVSLIVLTGAAWAVMLHHAISMSEPMGWAAHGVMGEMSDKPTVGGLGIFVAVWTVMMAATMRKAVISPAAHAQQRAVPVIGASPDALADTPRALRQGLKDTGYDEGERSNTAGPRIKMT